MQEHKEQNVDKIRAAFKLFSTYFKTWSDERLLDLYHKSSFKRYVRGELILGYGEGQTDQTYFLLHGECSVIQAIEEKRTKSSQKTTLAQLCVFLRGATFNIGDEMNGRCVVSRSLEVWCLLVPRSALLQHNIDNVWTRVQMLLQDRLPSSPEHLLVDLRRARKWQLQSQAIVTNILTKCS